MPLSVTRKNIEAVLRQVVEAGEDLRYFFGAGRKAVALTTSGRLVVTNVPLFGSAQIVFASKADDLEEIDFTNKNEVQGELSIRGSSGGIRITMPLIGPDDPVRRVREFLELVEKEKIADRPSYLDDDETILQTGKTREGLIRITDKRFYKLSTAKTDGPAEVMEKRDLTDLSGFDAYPGSFDSIKLAFAWPGGHTETATFRSALPGAENDPDKEAARILAALHAQGIAPKRAYIKEGENILTSVRAGKGTGGAILPNHVLRLTDQRIIFLKEAKSGLLEEVESFPLGQIARASLLGLRDQNTRRISVWRLRLKTTDGRRGSYGVPGEYEYGIAAIREAVNRYEDDEEAEA